MTTQDEKLKIMRLIQEGKITAEEGIELLDLIGKHRDPVRGNNTTTEGAARSKAQWFRVVVTDIKSGKTRVNIRMPVSLLNTGIKMGARFSPGVEGFDPGTISSFIQSGAVGKVIDVVDEAEGEHVEVYID